MMMKKKKNENIKIYYQDIIKYIPVDHYNYLNTL